jgi:hypothetical protein
MNLFPNWINTALEHLRKLIEISSEKIKSARLKEEQAKKVWEAAVKVVEAEESNKQRLCDDLKCLVCTLQAV